MKNAALLDNPIWSALSTEHQHLSLGDNLARCYLGEIGPLSGVAEQSSSAYEALRALAGSGGILGLFLQEPPIDRAGWSLVRGGALSQMIWAGSVLPEFSALPSSARHHAANLTPRDVPAMVELAKLTEPGPFRKRTSELGTFFGIFEDDRLLGMAGQRMRVPGFTEVSAVCTHPDARGRGYARRLMSAVMEDILAHERTPFLHAFADNYSAIRVYEALGYTLRRELHLAILKNEE